VAIASFCAIAALITHALIDINLNTNVFTALLFALIALTIRGSQLATVPAAPAPLETSLAQPEPPSSSAAYISLRACLWATAAVLLLVTLAGHWPPPLAPYVHIR
jgi:hypothetical protein